MSIPMQPVRSSNLTAVGYDPESMTLAVRFHSGKTYNYKGVPQDEYLSLVSATSVGSYFNQNIKDQYDAA